MSSTFGENIVVSLFGESHGYCVGATVDGFPAGIKLDFQYINEFMERRKPKLNAFSTSRLEDDTYKIVSGLTNGYTNGSPLTVIILNKSMNSDDYSNMINVVRPSHADFTASIKFRGYNDTLGGGHFSGRLMAPVCFVGAICKYVLEQRNVKVCSHLFSVGNVKDVPFNMTEVSSADINKIYKNDIPVISDDTGRKMIDLVKKINVKKDSVGGIIECACLGVPVGVGAPHFDGIENRLSSAMFGIPGIKGIEFGSGFDGCASFGSVNNDEFYMDKGSVKTKSNNCGGILGGISNGMPIIFRVAVKPASSIGIEQNTINLKTKENVRITVCGRHDSCIALRAVPCVEAMTSIVIYDMLLGRV